MKPSFVNGNGPLAALMPDGSIVIAAVRSAALRPREEEVERLAAGGSTLTEGMRAAVASLVTASEPHLAPAYSFIALAVAGAHEERTMLTDGAELPFGSRLTGPGPVALVGAVCSLGMGSDGLAARLGLGHLEAWLLDAVLLAGLGQLEVCCLGDLAGRAAAAGLCIGPPLVPAVAGMPAAAQPILFSYLGCQAAGVSLNEAGVMRPLKSFSCWYPVFSGDREVTHALDLCGGCDLTHCRFRGTADTRGRAQRRLDEQDGRSTAEKGLGDKT